jgi:hypothetical protein
MHRFLAILTFTFILLAATAQSVYLPYNIQDAYNKNTRSFSGEPGENYFQNKASYRIRANFDPKTGILKGNEHVVYYNNSPDSLYYFVIRLYHDILKKGNIRDEEIPAEYLTDGVEISSFKINNEEHTNNAVIYFKRSGTNLFVGLNGYTFPGDSIIFDIQWNTKIPGGDIHRFGKYGDGDWFIAYWYPQVSVYDDIDGWDIQNYTGQYEFYNDVNDFDVEITVPGKYLSWATGNWLNAKEILSTTVYERYLKSEKSDELIQIVTESDWKNKQVLQKNKSLTYHYEAIQVPDFAFAISNNYLWNAASSITDSVSEKRTVVNGAYPASAVDFSNLALIGAKAINEFSFKSLQVPYPYPNITLFNGNGGMEFPMMVNMRNKSYSKNVFTGMHELFHGYFPFYTGINERKYAWIDEGLTTYLPIETESAINDEMDFPLYKIIDRYNSFSGQDQDSPLFTPSMQLRDKSYYHQAYYRSSVAFAMLEQYLGRESFRGAIRLFTDTWKYKHPTGYDFIFTLNNAIDEDISWLIQPWFFGYGWADLAIKNGTNTSEGIDVEIENVGGLPVPVTLKVIPLEGEAFFIRHKADVWKDGKTITLHLSGHEKLNRLELGDLNIPDKVSTNNYFYFTQ